MDNNNQIQVNRNVPVSADLGSANIFLSQVPVTNKIENIEILNKLQPNNNILDNMTPQTVSPVFLVSNFPNQNLNNAAVGIAAEEYLSLNKPNVNKATINYFISPDNNKLENADPNSSIIGNGYDIADPEEVFSIIKENHEKAKNFRNYLISAFCVGIVTSIVVGSIGAALSATTSHLLGKLLSSFGFACVIVFVMGIVTFFM